ncbi:MAG TPA: hypothetical protein VNL77_08950 [Roseiflexaceae bacterium]|nr:hypothetical protein [Roseiflexaceae bacterium]
MNYLALPRVAFAGTDAMANPSTANNNNTMNLVDHAYVRLRNPKQLDPPAYRAWLMSPITLTILPTPDQPGATFASLMGLWNYFGDHAVSFGSAATTSITLADGRALLPHESADPLLGAAVSLSARIVDLDPADNYCTQIIAGAFRVFGQDTAGRPVTLLHGERPTVACSRWLSDSRPFGAGMFQCVIPNERLEFDESGRSPALDALRAAAHAGAGIALRYCFYTMRTRPGMTPAFLAEQFAQGVPLANPKYGMLAGSFGPWDGAGLRSAPVGRVLYRPSSPLCAPAPGATEAPRPHIKTHEDLEHLWRGRAAAPQTPAAPGIGPAVAVVDLERQTVALDLLSTFPEAAPDDMTKFDFGPVSLRLSHTAADGTQQDVVVGPVAYDRASYETFGGVVEVPLAGRDDVAPLLDAGRIWLCRDADGAALLREIATVQVETDDRCVYLQEGEPTTITVRVFERGRPSERAVRLRIQQWRDYNRPEPVDETTTPPTVTAAFFGYERVRRGDPDLLVAPAITAPPGGVARLRLRPRRPGSYKLRFIPPGAAVDPTHPDWGTEFFANLRVLPDDDYSGVGDETIASWSFMYQEVFGYYTLMYPMMATIIPWGPHDAPDDPERVRTFAALIRQFVDEQVLDSPMYMPITRELSAGKRRLIQRWCELQLGPARAQEPPP